MYSPNVNLQVAGSQMKICIQRAPTHCRPELSVVKVGSAVVVPTQVWCTAGDRTVCSFKATGD